ncbi:MULTISPECIES: 1-phosphofructokinase family hexose kinase [unclassified Streptomyces]|uniref:1-phosphofructokinase family hexose kinase n=1 Tax=unclassified Streptomyces TaxID=2593676 RepID=UPI002E20B471|nr:PfkB family carbohydrate kinase [Streptomyces sp. NBC_01023]
MSIAITSLNSAIERLLAVHSHRPGSVHRLTRSETLAGGKGVNVARVLTQLAAGRPETSEPVPEPLLLGFSGGPTGRLFEDLLAAEHLATSLVTTSGATRVCEVLVDLSDPAGATVYNASGPHVERPELEALEGLFAGHMAKSEALVCTGSLPPGVPADQYARWIARARNRGILSVLDAHGEALALGAAALPDVVKVNREELSSLGTGDPAARALDWLDAGIRCVIITDGGRPARAFTAEAAYEVLAPEVPVRSAVGSGDAFCAGLVRSLLGTPQAGWAAHLRTAAACGASNAANITAGLAASHSPAALVPRVTVRESALRSARPPVPRPEDARG